MGGAGRIEVSGTELGFIPGMQWKFLSCILALWEQTLRDRRVLSLGEDSLLKLAAENQARLAPRERAPRHGACCF